MKNLRLPWPLALAAALLVTAGCLSGRPRPVRIQPPGANRPLSELVALARSDRPLPADLSPGDRDTVAKMRAAR